MGGGGGVKLFRLERKRGATNWWSDGYNSSSVPRKHESLEY